MLLALQQHPARRRRLLAGARDTPAQGLPDAPPDRPGVAQERAPGHLPVTVLVPPVEAVFIVAVHCVKSAFPGSARFARITGVWMPLTSSNRMCERGGLGPKRSSI